MQAAREILKVFLSLSSEDSLHTQTVFSSAPNCISHSLEQTGQLDNKVSLGKLDCSSATAPRYLICDTLGEQGLSDLVESAFPLDFTYTLLSKSSSIAV